MTDQSEKTNGYDAGTNGRPRASLADRMRVELLVNEDSQVWLLHDQPFEAILQWAEYDGESGDFNIVTHDGAVHPLGMIVPETTARLLATAPEMCVIYMKDGQEIQDIGIIPVMASVPFYSGEGV